MMFPGKAALKYLLNGADHLTSFGDSGMYLKRGGYRAALRDFKAVHPTQVEVVHDIHGVVSNTMDKHVTLIIFASILTNLASKQS